MDVSPFSIWRKNLLKNKKILIIATVVVLLLIGVFFYWWQGMKIEKPRPEKLENYLIQEEATEKIIKNKNIGLAFKIARDWQIKKTEYLTSSRGGNDWGLILTSPDFVANPNSYWILIPQKGCLINVFARHDQKRAEWIKTEMELAKKGSLAQKEVISLSGQEALKTIFGEKDSQKDSQGLVYLVIEATRGNIVYTFESYLLGQEKERCLADFNDFFKTVSISK